MGADARSGELGAATPDGPGHESARAANLVWAVLVLATVASYLLGAEHLIDDQNVVAGLVVGVAFVKVRLVGIHFMELGRAPLPLRLVFEAYCAITFLVLLVLYLAS